MRIELDERGHAFRACNIAMSPSGGVSPTDTPWPAVLAVSGVRKSVEDLLLAFSRIFFCTCFRYPMAKLHLGAKRSMGRPVSRTNRLSRCPPICTAWCTRSRQPSRRPPAPAAPSTPSLPSFCPSPWRPSESLESYVAGCGLKKKRFSKRSARETVQTDSMSPTWVPRSPDSRFLETTVYRADYIPVPIHRALKPAWQWPGHIPSAETTSSYEDAFSPNKGYKRAQSSHDYSRQRTHVSSNLRFVEKTTNQAETRTA
jgi:hypothetical protein